MHVELVIAIALVVTGFYVGWNIGANDAANCIGTTVGARIISFRKAALLMAVCVIIGGVLQGHHVMKTVGKGIVISSAETYENAHNKPPPKNFVQFFPDEKLPDLAIFCCTYFCWPIRNFGYLFQYPCIDVAVHRRGRSWSRVGNRWIPGELFQTEYSHKNIFMLGN